VSKILKKYVKKGGFKAQRLERLSEAQKLRRVSEIKKLFENSSAVNLSLACLVD